MHIHISSNAAMFAAIFIISLGNDISVNIYETNMVNMRPFKFHSQF